MVRTSWTVIGEKAEEAKNRIGVSEKRVRRTSTIYIKVDNEDTGMVLTDIYAEVAYLCPDNNRN